MSYRISLEKRPLKALLSLPAGDRLRLEAHIDDLAEEPRPPGITQLRGRWRPAYRLRVGDYRIIYYVDDGTRTVSVAAIGHRSHVYD